MNEGILIASSARGRYAVKDAGEGPYYDITSGDVCFVWLGGVWIRGSIEHIGAVYVDPDFPHKLVRGYYFIADNGGSCGLAIGMKVRVP